MSAKPPERALPELILVVPASARASDLADILGQSDIAALIADAKGRALASLLTTARAHGVPVLVPAGSVAAAAAGGADGDAGGVPDGVHATGPLEARLAAIGARRAPAMVGAVAQDRHEAMLLAEAGADYVAFAADDLGAEAARALAAWWQPLFEVPVVVAGPLSDLAENAATGAEFVAVTDLFAAADPRHAVREAARVLAGETVP